MDVRIVAALAALGVAVVVATLLAARGKRLRIALAEAEARAAGLAKYQAIPDAEAHAARVIAEAKGRAADLVNDAESTASMMRTVAEASAAQSADEARRKAAEVLDEALAKRQKADDYLEARRKEAGLNVSESLETLSQARAEAGAIVAEARVKAEDVAGEALEAKRDADKWVKTVEAMKNVVEGYGDRYLIPTFSVLDALGEEYGFDEAGQKLKAAREHTRRMVKERTAATTDYVEANRRETAIDFVVDAFNGKVDTILASAKRDNYGTLEQRIRDACALVDHNGEAFRNARVEPDYLAARLQELKWAVAVHELREKDKEEQRQLREQIREEEKAQREYERAIKEAAKEEETLHKLQARVQAEFDKATDEQKTKYEKQLQEVNERLRVAEEKNKRALSMAQQTRAGHIYVISNQGSFGENVLKIGMTRRLEPEDRIRELGDASVPFAFDIHALIRSDDAPTLERALHKKFVVGQVNKVNPRKEFFRVQVEEVRSEVERLGLAATWTVTAAAREYHETLAIEKAMREKTFDTKDWANKQVKEHDAAVVEAVAAEEEPV
jgi:hypothetical protein